MREAIERGVILAIQEWANLSQEERDARIIVGDADAEVQRDMLAIAALSIFPMVRELTPIERLHRQTMLAILRNVEEWPGAEAVKQMLLERAMERAEGLAKLRRKT